MIKDYLGDEWFDLIGNEFEKEYMANLSKFITHEREMHTVYPSSTEETFSVFRNLQPSNIKVVIIGQDPYPDGSYDGKAFSNSESKHTLSPSLVNILKEVEDDIYGGFNLSPSPNLSRWESQGVFLVNRILTVRKDKPLSHAGKGWEIFTANVINLLSSYKSGIVFMLWGNNAKEAKRYIEGNDHLILESGHPSPLSANRGYWFGNKHFSQANEFLNKKYNKIIEW